MNSLILDCTLRDGGYVNSWEFGEENILKVSKYLSDANIDIIELGFLKQDIIYNSDYSLFPDFKTASVFASNNIKSKFVLMLNFGEYCIENIPNQKDTNIFGIRVVFHKKESIEAVKFSEKLIEKGFEVFIQPMVTQNYTENEFKDLIDKVNLINPYALYIVDSFGSIEAKHIEIFMNIIDKNLNEDINIGFHPHNNLQLAYSNSTYFNSFPTKQKKIIDASLYGMGRGAGNLTTELFSHYLNEQNKNNEYVISELLKCMDEVLGKIRFQFDWGYSIPFYISAKNICHPNYASFFSNKNTLSYEQLDKLISSIEKNDRMSFSEKFAEEKYLEFQNHEVNDVQVRADLKKIFKDKKILVIGPGQSIKKYKDKINQFIKFMNPIIISLNYRHDLSNFIFISNQKRYVQFNEEFPYCNQKIIATSNIPFLNAPNFIVNYKSLVNSYCNVSDNSLLLLLRLLLDIQVNDVFIAGIDGYIDNFTNNYFESYLELPTCDNLLQSLNCEINNALVSLKDEINIKSITQTQYTIDVIEDSYE